MKLGLFFIIAVISLELALPVRLVAQSDNLGPSLGDLARSLRQQSKAPKAPPAHTVIDNDNLTQVMNQVEGQRLNGRMLFSFDGVGKNFQVSSPDVTCSLSFSAQATALLSDSYVAQNLPAGELAKLEGPATIDGDSLQISVFNGTGWNLKEITVGLTVLRAREAKTAYFGPAKLVPAAATSDVPTEKPSDITVLYRLKGAAAPLTTTVFRETLGTVLAPDQDWHWAIVEAKGIPPK
ncbi:MAG TPA: hypothetical protein VMO80_04695 [Terriglobales bacterium]|jgi:hypothetical protein|nr:hypothetical protein [Terriglobales bacterium]